MSIAVVSPGIVGCGRAVERGHLLALAGIEDVRLVAVADPLAGRRRIATEVGRYPELGDMRAAEQLDTVLICSPPAFHLQGAEHCAAAGIRTLLEVRRGFPEDPLFDLGCHRVDLGCWVTGTRPTRGRAVGLGSDRVGFELEMTDGLLLRAECGPAPTYRELVELRSEEGELRTWRWPAPAPAHEKLKDRLRRRPHPLVASWRAQLRGLADLVRSGNPGRLALAQQRIAVMGVLEAVRDSAASGGAWLTVPAQIRQARDGDPDAAIFEAASDTVSGREFPMELRHIDHLGANVRYPAPLPEPLVSVVLTVRDGGDLIDDQLAALARQTMHQPWEVVVVDNGSRDATVERVQAWLARLPPTQVLQGPAEPCRCAALNLGVAAARADRLVFCDHDDVVGDGWVEAMCEALADHVHVTGPVELARLNPAELVWGEHVATWRAGPIPHPFRPFAVTGNSGWRRETLERLGGFDESLQSGYDTDLSWRVQLSGSALWFAEGAVVYRRLRPSALAAFRQHLGYGRGDAALIARFRSYGARRSRAETWRAWAELAARLPWLLRRGRRMRWAEMAGLQLGRALPLSRVQRRLLRSRPDIPMAGDGMVQRYEWRGGGGRAQA